MPNLVGVIARPAIAFVGSRVAGEILVAALSLLIAWELTQALPRVIPWPGHGPGAGTGEQPYEWPFDKIGRNLRDVPWEIAKTLTAMCAASAAVSFAGVNPSDLCSGNLGPVFMPGGSQVDATLHILMAIIGHPSWATLTRTSRVLPPQWYNKVKYGRPCPGVSGSDCDEYPFGKTREGGPGLPYYTDPTDPGKWGASVWPINSLDNQLQGTALGVFYGQCKIPPDSGAVSQFKVIPVPFLPTTLWRCGR
jgi:hypothetical protein